MNKQQQRSEETRMRLLSAAEICFAQFGYDASSVTAICQSAGVSKGAFYHHFPSKEEIFLELLKRWLEGLNAQMVVLRDNTVSVPEALISMTDVVQNVLRTAQNQLPIYLEFWNRATRDPELLQAMIEPFHRYRALFAEMIEGGISEGSLRKVDPQIAASVIVSMAVGVLIQGLLDPMEADWGQITQEGIIILLGGLRTEVTE